MSDSIQKMSNNEAVSEEALANLLMQGDLSSLTMVQRAQFLYHFARSKGLDPATKPFDLIVLNNKLTLYANRSAADQIRKIHNITTERTYCGPLREGTDPDGKPRFDYTVWEVEYKLTDGAGRVEISTGCVGIEGLKGEAKGNAVMKCDTKAKRRGTLSMGGLGFLDELEVESVQKLNESGAGEGKPRRVFPRPAPAVVAAEMQNTTPTPFIEASAVSVVEEAAPAVEAISAQKPPSFPTAAKPLPSVKPPVRMS